MYEEVARKESDTIEAICEEAVEVFRFDKELRPQDRAHKYLEEHKVNRGYNDTALQVCVLDLIGRAYQIGAKEAFARDLGLERKVAVLTEISADLLQSAITLRGLAAPPSSNGYHIEDGTGLDQGE